MSTALIGETRGNDNRSMARVAVLVGTDTRIDLTELLREPYMAGVSPSEFMDRAIARAREEAEEQGPAMDAFVNPLDAS